MKSLPRVLIMGRPNVGKSTLINRIFGKNQAITLDIPGVTRDLSEMNTDWNGKHFTLVDSGGVLFEGTQAESIQEKIESLVVGEMERADQILFLTEFNTGVHPLDAVVGKWLRPYSEKVTLAVNKVDDFENVSFIQDFYQLGFGKPFPVSAGHGMGIGDILDVLTHKFQKGNAPDETTYSIAFVGRPNVGKSSLLNAILNENRVMVDDVAGTTRDAIEAYYHHQGYRYMFTDTAGIRRKAKIDDGIEYYSVVRSDRAIARADVVVVLLNPDLLMCDQDKKIINRVLEAKRNMIIFVNKWDLTERTADMQSELQRIATHEMPVLENFPFIFGSATEKVHLGRLLDKIPQVVQNSKIRIPTAALNAFIDQVIKRNPPPAKYGERIKIFYATQVSVGPPTFIFFVNKTKVIEKDYQRFVENRLRVQFPEFEGVPIQVYFKERRKIKLEPKQKNTKP